jgi:hypothetical protein
MCELRCGSEAKPRSSARLGNKKKLEAFTAAGGSHLDAPVADVLDARVDDVLRPEVLVLVDVQPRDVNVKLSRNRQVEAVVPRRADLLRRRVAFGADNDRRRERRRRRKEFVNKQLKRRRNRNRALPRELRVAGRNGAPAQRRLRSDCRALAPPPPPLYRIASGCPGPS